MFCSHCAFSVMGMRRLVLRLPHSTYLVVFLLVVASMNVGCKEPMNPKSEGSNFTKCQTDDCGPEGPRGARGIHQLAREGTVEEMLHTLNRGTDVNCRDAHGSTPLHKAVAAHRTDLIRVLLQHGAKVDAANQMGGTPLHQAAYRGFLEVAIQLLDAGADPDVRNIPYMYTPLDLASERGHLAIVVLLLERNAKLDADIEGQIVSIELARKSGHLDIVQVIELYARRRHGE